MRHLLVLFLALHTWSASAQITEEFNNTPLKEVFSILESKYKIKIAYDPKLIVHEKVTAKLDDVSPEEAFKILLKNTQLSFSKVKSNYFSVQPSKVEWSLNGTIKDEDGFSIPFAKIRIVGTRRGTHADADGNYVIKYKSDEPPTIEISAFGYKNIHFLASSSSHNYGKDITLKTNIVEYPDVVVEYLTEGIFTEEDVSSLSIRPVKLGTVPGTTEPDVFQLIQTVPGINSASSTVNEIQIRGGTADQNQLLWDGIPVYHPGHFNGMISSVNPNIVHKANLHRGVYDPYYGGKASGLIDLHSLDDVPSRLKATAGINMLQADAYLVTPLSEKLAVMISGRRSYTDLWKSPTYNKYAERVYQETEIENTGTFEEKDDFNGEIINQTEVQNNFIYSDLNAKIIYKPNEHDLLTISSIYTNNSLIYSTVQTENNETLENELNSSNFGIGAHYFHQWNDKWETDIQANFARYNYFFFYKLTVQEEDTLLVAEEINKDNNVLHTDVKLKNRYTINENHTIDFGYQVKLNSVSYGITSSEDEDSVASVGSNDGFINTLHFNHIWKKGKWLSKIGTRVSHLTIHEDLYFEPRLYVQYKIAKPLTVKSSFGIQNQFVSQIDQIDDAQLGLSNRVWVMTDSAEIPVVRSIIADAGVVFQKKGWYLETEAYWKSLSNIVSFSDNPTLSSGLLRGNAIAMGVDLLIKKRWKNFRTWISYSYSNVDYSFEDITDASFPAPFNQPHTLKWGNTLKWRNFEFASAFKVASGMPYTPLSDVILDPDPDPWAEGEELYMMVLGTPNSKRLPIFHQLDLTVFYNMPNDPDRRWNMKIGLSCFNVYNKINVLNRSYELEFNDEDPLNPHVDSYAIDRYFLGITPNALIRIEFK